MNRIMIIEEKNLRLLPTKDCAELARLCNKGECPCYVFIYRGYPCPFSEIKENCKEIETRHWRHATLNFDKIKENEKNTKENAPRRVKKFVEIEGTFIRLSRIESIVITKASIINEKNTLNVFTTGSKKPFYFYRDTLEQVEEMAQELLNACEEE